MKSSLIISDLDGTLIDTQAANLAAYKKAADALNISVSDEKYISCFGLNFNDMCDTIGIPVEVRSEYKRLKKEFYPSCFNLAKPNYILIDELKKAKAEGTKIALGTTASKPNVINILTHFGLLDLFDYILAGEDVSKGKPDPEVYLKIMAHFVIEPQDTIIYEDSEVGLAAAEDAGAVVIKVEKWN